MKETNETMKFSLKKDNKEEARKILETVYKALEFKGYNPINQLTGYILSGDPTYITSHDNARVIVRSLERDELLEEVLKNYLNTMENK